MHAFLTILENETIPIICYVEAVKTSLWPILSRDPFIHVSSHPVLLRHLEGTKRFVGV